MTTLTWLGHAGFLIESEGTRVAVDAWPDGPTFPGTDLSDVDLFLVSHGHYDHCENVPTLVKAAGATLVCIHEITFWAKQHGVPAERVVGMNKGGTLEQDGWRFTMVQAVHSGGCPGPEDSIVPGGSAAGFIIECPDGERIYHAGDTTVFLDMQLIRDLYQPRIALLPIGGHFTMGPREAGKALELLGTDHVIPMHYGTFPLLVGTPEELRRHAPENVAVHVLEPGETFSLDTVTVADAA